MRRIQLAAFICLSIFFISCQQEVDPDLITDPTNPGNPVNNSESYHPLSTNSFWKFRDSASGTISTMKAINVTKNINGRTHTAILTMSGSQTDTVWAASPKPNYYYNMKGFSPNTGAPFDLLFHYLNDTASVGSSWNYNAGHGNGFAALMTTTVMEKNMTITIAGKTYTNVIHTRLNLSYDLMGVVTDVGFYDYYTSKGIGIVRIRGELGYFGFINISSSDLVDHNIE